MVGPPASANTNRAPARPPAPRARPRPQYAQWEEGQKDFRRARSVWERALDNDYRSTTVWLKVGGGVERRAAWCCVVLCNSSRGETPG